MIEHWEDRANGTFLTLLAGRRQAAGHDACGGLLRQDRAKPRWPRSAAFDEWRFRDNDGMKSHTEYLEFNLNARMAFENITPIVAEIVRKSGIREGLLLVNAMHITASVFINDDEPGLHADYKKWLEGLAPFDPSPERYAHNRTGEDNADAHMKRQIMGREVVGAVTGGKLDFGPWEQIFYGEFDGRRRKRVLVKVIGE
jgi:secondary thiamine-phosphate synthase enzyme